MKRKPGRPPAKKLDNPYSTPPNVAYRPMVATNGLRISGSPYDPRRIINDNSTASTSGSASPSIYGPGPSNLGPSRMKDADNESSGSSGLVDPDADMEVKPTIRLSQPPTSHTLPRPLYSTNSANHYISMPQYLPASWNGVRGRPPANPHLSSSGPRSSSPAHPSPRPDTSYPMVGTSSSRPSPPNAPTDGELWRARMESRPIYSSQPKPNKPNGSSVPSPQPKTSKPSGNAMDIDSILDKPSANGNGVSNGPGSSSKSGAVSLSA